MFCFITRSFINVSEEVTHVCINIKNNITVYLVTDKHTLIYCGWSFGIGYAVATENSRRCTHSHTCSFLQQRQLGLGERQWSLMKYSSLEFKDSTVGPVKGRPRDGDVSRSFMTLE